MPDSQFLGPKKVIATIIENFKTEGGNEIITARFEDGSKETMPMAAYADLVTSTASDFTELSKKRIGTLVLKLLKVVSEYDLKTGEIESLRNSLANELSNMVNRATSFLWTGDDAKFVPGFNVVFDKSILDAQMVLRKIPTVAAVQPETPPASPAQGDASTGSPAVA